MDSADSPVHGSAPERNRPAEWRIRPLRWWELEVVAAADARIFGPTAWTLSYYWAVKAQPGTTMLAVELPHTSGSAGESLGPVASAGEMPTSAASAKDTTAEPADLSEETLGGWIVMSAAGRDADVMTVATTERARGRGIGRALVETGIGWALTHGAHTIHLEVDSANAPAIGLYESLGFEEWGRRPDYYPGSDAILMRLRLSSLSDDDPILRRLRTTG